MINILQPIQVYNISCSQTFETPNDEGACVPRLVYVVTDKIMSNWRFRCILDAFALILLSRYSRSAEWTSNK
jgi:hypothetical protein